MSNKCKFCNELNNINYPLQSKLGLNSTILAENKNWAILPALGSVVNGYIMIVNKLHYFSIATCPTEQFEELEKIISLCRNVLRKEYNQECIFFEHGSLSKDMLGSNSIEHIHLHVVPLGKDLSFSFKSANLHETIQSLYDLKEKALKNNCAYLFYEDCNKNRFYIKDENAFFPSQFFRQQIAKLVGRSNEWNWKTHPNYNEFLSTYFKLKGKLEI